MIMFFNNSKEECEPPLEKICLTIMFINVCKVNLINMFIKYVNLQFQLVNEVIKNILYYNQKNKTGTINELDINQNEE